MTSEHCEAKAEQARVMALFKAGRSKSEIAAELGKTRAQVAKLLAQAIRGKANAGA